MQQRRNSIIRKEQFQDGVRIGTMMHVSGRYPQEGKHSDCAKNTLIYVVKGSGMLERNNERTALSAGSVLQLKHCDLYFLKGQLSLYMIDASRI